MRDEDAIYLEMFRRLKLFGSTNALTFTPYLNITGCFVDYNVLLALYETQCDELEIKTTGTTEDKVNARLNLEINVLGIAKPLAGHFFGISNMELYKQLKCTPAMLSKLRESELLSFTANLLTVCTANPLVLTATNILPAKITALIAANTAFKTIEPEPQTNIKNRTGKIKVKNATRRKIVSLIRNRMTNAMYGLIGVEDALLTDYLNIIKLVTTGIRHNTSSETTVIKSFEFLSATTNARVMDVMLNFPELALTLKCKKDGSFAKEVFPVKTLAISAFAFGYELYNAPHVFTNIDNEVITILLVPLS